MLHTAAENRIERERAQQALSLARRAFMAAGASPEHDIAAQLEAIRTKALTSARAANKKNLI
eukprot:scaffold30032_cov138-Isochrysis_galbana.AAC.14